MVFQEDLVSNKCTLEIFSKDVSGHEMIVIQDEGVYRHIRFGRPDDGNMHFNLTTWPHYLCFSGDMGCFVFSRISDMFEFFRCHKINPSYWSEKLKAVDRGDGFEKYSEELFTSRISDWLDDIEADSDLRESVKDEVLSRADDGEHEAINAAIQFEHKSRRVFQDFWETNCREHGFRFIWCCHAIVWGISKYDAAKIPVAS